MPQSLIFERERERESEREKDRERDSGINRHLLNTSTLNSNARALQESQIHIYFADTSISVGPYSNLLTAEIVLKKKKRKKEQTKEKGKEGRHLK